MASGWNLWVCLECIGVVSGCCCKEMYRYPHNYYYFSLLHLFKLFFGCSFLNVMFFRSCLLFLCKYSKHCSKTIRNHSKIEIT